MDLAPAPRRFSAAGSCSDDVEHQESDGARKLKDGIRGGIWFGMGR